jgi:hypothetical protein
MIANNAVGNDMQPTFKQLTDFFVSIGAENVAHTEKSYLAHAIGVYHDLQQWGADEQLCRAGMYHSIYGTEHFQRFKLSLERRSEVRDLIGERGERIAFCNCVMDRATFDEAARRREPPYRFHDRISGDEIELSPPDFEDLCRVHLCDWLEQVPRSQDWEYRRAAYRQLAERLGGVALESYNRVFARETAELARAINP